MIPEIQTILDVVQSFGWGMVFLYLYLSEKRDHTETRKNKDLEIERLRAAHLADIREFARIGQSLYQVGSRDNPAVPRDRNEVNHGVAPLLPTPS